jgi:hypothetical protein
VPLDQYQTPFNVGIGVVIPAGSSATYTVEHTFDDVFAPTFNPATAVWFPHATLAAKSTSSDGNYAFPVAATRINAAAVTGSVIFNVRQAGAKG